MKAVLVTGAKGFIGKNLCAVLRERKDIRLLEADIDTTATEYASSVAEADLVYHLAGVNRPKDPGEFETGNAGTVEHLVALASTAGKAPTLVLTSSIQAALDNAYGVSKRHAEEAARAWGQRSGASVRVFRLANAFGKWCRPFYNSVVATFCHQAAHGEPFRIDDPSKIVEFVYVDDIVRALVGLLDGIEPPMREGFCVVEPSFHVSIGELAEKLGRFVASRRSCVLPELSDTFEKYLYSTYLSYLEPAEFVYGADKKADARGYLFELVKSPHAGQIFVSRTLPGVTRGNHYHHTKVEKFCVVDGKARIAFQHVATGERANLEVEGQECRVVDIPPGWTHNITNIGEGDLITLFWANEIFSPERPDTYFAEVDDAAH